MSKKTSAKTAKNPREAAISAALTLAAERGWTATGMADIAAHSGIPLA
ncbi:MAG: TetR family transcriptional regulator, partial [Alphaproteobacteria bacterium]|nr:TetR family transcriptional regulator [Alphaproteobacteria bacterium]